MRTKAITIMATALTSLTLVAAKCGTQEPKAEPGATGERAGTRAEPPAVSPRSSRPAPLPTDPRSPPRPGHSAAD